MLTRADEMYLRESREAAGVPARLDDPAVLADLADLLRADNTTPDRSDAEPDRAMTR